ncbi:hypothetical protein HMPREF9723_02150 [Treponema denticola OTK]|uniref:Uncharacterized protein n=1 Tax=Treponema denticola OTK TaxID=999434 RepID=A0A0F6MNQ8_TREDN|nr:hypothetical protein HMPREF9723_02150 [Treponema denticola OTK]DAK62921.1 MAG TPA: Rifin [Caudoviricetes sp.]
MRSKLIKTLNIVLVIFIIVTVISIVFKILRFF